MYLQGANFTPESLVTDLLQLEETKRMAVPAIDHVQPTTLDEVLVYELAVKAYVLLSPPVCLQCILLIILASMRLGLLVYHVLTFLDGSKISMETSLRSHSYFPSYFMCVDSMYFILFNTMS